MIEEDFDEENLIAAPGGDSRILEDYPLELRCLILGYFQVVKRFPSLSMSFAIIPIQTCWTSSPPTFPRNPGGQPPASEADDMNNPMKSKCSECGGKVHRKSITQEFEKEGTRVKLCGLKAWVCGRCGEVFFAPGGAQQVVQAVNSLFRLAFAEREHKGTLSAQLS